MTDINDILGKPFVTQTGKNIPDYALPILKAYYEALPLEDPESYTSPVTTEVAISTIIAVEKTLKKLNGGVETRDLSLLPAEEYEKLSSRRLPDLIDPSIIKGSGKYRTESEQLNQFAMSVWLMVADSLNLPHLKPERTLKATIDKNYKYSSVKKGALIWGAIALVLLGLGALTVVAVGTNLNYAWLVVVVMVLAACYLGGGLIIADLHDEAISKKRKKVYYQNFKDQQQVEIKKELESFILQTQKP